MKELDHKPNVGCFTRWLSTLNVCRDVKGCLDQLVQMKQDRQWAKRLGSVVCDAVTAMNGMRNELNACIVVLSAFEEPVIRLQVLSEDSTN